MRRVEEALTFDPRAERRALLDRTAVALADAPTLRRRIAQALGEGPDAAQLAVDRLLTGTDELNVNYLERGMIAADAVAPRRSAQWRERSRRIATGFMISSRLLLTNHHVLPTADDAAQSWVHFRYEFDAFGNAVESCVFALEPSAVLLYRRRPRHHRRCRRAGDARSSSARRALWLASPLGQPGHGAAGRVALDGAPSRRQAEAGRSSSELAHEKPRRSSSGTRTETAWASSGAPVFNDSWQVVAIHRGGAPARDRAGRVLTVDGAALGRWTTTKRASSGAWASDARAARSSTASRHLCGDHPLIERSAGSRRCRRERRDRVAVRLRSRAGDAASSPEVYSGRAPSPLGREQWRRIQRRSSARSLRTKSGRNRNGSAADYRSDRERFRAGAGRRGEPELRLFGAQPTGTGCTAASARAAASSRGVISGSPDFASLWKKSLNPVYWTGSATS